MKYMKLTACLAAAVMSFGCLNVLPYNFAKQGVISASAEESGDFGFSSVDSGVVITEYIGDGGNVTVPDKLNGKKVVARQLRLSKQKPMIFSNASMLLIPKSLKNLRKYLVVNSTLIKMRMVI